MAAPAGVASLAWGPAAAAAMLEHGVLIGGQAGLQGLAPCGLGVALALHAAQLQAELVQLAVMLLGSGRPGSAYGLHAWRASQLHLAAVLCA